MFCLRLEIKFFECKVMTSKWPFVNGPQLQMAILKTVSKNLTQRVLCNATVVVFHLNTESTGDPLVTVFFICFLCMTLEVVFILIFTVIRTSLLCWFRVRPKN